MVKRNRAFKLQTNHIYQYEKNTYWHKLCTCQILLNQTHYQPNIALWDHILTQIIVVPNVNQLPSPLWQLSIISVPHMFSKNIYDHWFPSIFFGISPFFFSFRTLWNVLVLCTIHHMWIRSNPLRCNLSFTLQVWAFENLKRMRGCNHL